MLRKLPRYPGQLADLIADLGHPNNLQVAKALGVSRRTVERWHKMGAPRTALLSLWWLSREGHSFWDCEMHQRTVMAVQTNAALWTEVRELRKKLETAPALITDLRAYGPPANESSAGQVCMS